MVTKLKNYSAFLLLILAFEQTKASDNFTGPEFSMFTVRNSNSNQPVNGLFENIRFLDGNYRGWDLNLPFNRNCYFSFGIGLKKISYRKEIEGVFPETGQYGLAVVDGHCDYWTFPLSVAWINSKSTYGYRNSYNSKGTYNKGLKISYVPSVQSSSKTTIGTIGGAVLSNYANDYSPGEQVFQHSVTFSFCNQLFPFRGSLRLNVDPFVTLGTSYFKSGGSAINTLGCGINIALQFKVPHITIEKHTRPDPSKADKKKELEKKQKEIEEQLKKGKVESRK